MLAPSAVFITYELVLVAFADEESKAWPLPGSGNKGAEIADSQGVLFQAIAKLVVKLLGRHDSDAIAAALRRSTVIGIVLYRIVPNHTLLP